MEPRFGEDDRHSLHAQLQATPGSGENGISVISDLVYFLQGALVSACCYWSDVAATPFISSPLTGSALQTGRSGGQELLLQPR